MRAVVGGYVVAVVCPQSQYLVSPGHRCRARPVHARVDDGEALALFCFIHCYGNKVLVWWLGVVDTGTSIEKARYCFVTSIPRCPPKKIDGK